MRMINFEAQRDRRFGIGLIRWFTQNEQVRKGVVLATVLVGSVVAADAKTIYVDGAVATPGNGTTWNRAYKFLRDGLDASVRGDQIFLAQGTYFPDDGISGEFGNREMSFDLDGVKIYGGFVGNETSLDQRNVLANPTTLSGAIWDDLPGDDVYWSLHVVVVDTNSTLDGVIVEKGNANGRASFNFPGIDFYDEGGGGYVRAGQRLTLQNCIFRRNRALSFGGAIMVADTSGRVVATDSVFELNEIPIYNVTTSVPAGGAIKGNVTATNCKFTANKIFAINFVGSTTASASGGAIAGDVNATGCDFIGNTIIASAFTPTTSGGAISGNVIAEKCLFSGNESIPDVILPPPTVPPAEPPPTGDPIAYGGAIRGGSLRAVSCTFSANKSGPGKVNDDGTIVGGGGAVSLSTNSSYVVNCVFVKNTSEVGGGAIHAETGSFSDILTVSNSTFVDNGVTTNFEGAAIFCGSLVTILNNVFWNTADTAGTFDQDNLIQVANKGVVRNTDVRYPTPATIAQNVVKGGRPSINLGEGGVRILGNFTETLVTGDPRFANAADPDGADDMFGTFDDGLRILAGSSAIGSARDPRVPSYRNFLANDTLDIDEDGNTTEPLPSDVASYIRTQGRHLDMGAYEFGNILNSSDIQVERPAGTVLVDGSATAIDFSALVGVPTTFVIKNLGSLNLNKLSIIGDGPDIDSFKFTQPAASSLGGGSSTTFTVFFKPTATGVRNAALHIRSNDPDESPFDINLSGSSQLSEIAVESPVGTNLTDGVSVVNYGSVGETSSATRTYTIRNSGLANLGILGITSSGPDAANFTASAPGLALIPPGGTTTFTATFRPSGSGTRNASIVIENSDPDNESSFLIKVTGTGVGAPEILVSQPFSSELKDGSTTSFGSVAIGSLHSNTFVVKNTGSVTLKNIAVSLSGPGAFSMTKIGVTSLKAGAQADFTVTFKPTATGSKTAVLTIASNDSNESRLELNLTGKGVAKSSPPSAGIAAASAPFMSNASPTDSAGGAVSVTRELDGLKYLVLTVDKPAGWGLAQHKVEVSPNLVDWFSGAKHTTTLTDNDAILRVRDNTPVKQGEKRYIRLK